MANVLFSNAYLYRHDPKQWKMQQPYPPLGTLYAAALLRQAGHQVKLFDANLIQETKEILPVLKTQKPQYLVIYDDGFNYLTKMCLSKMREAAFAFIAFGKKQGCTVIISSSDSTDHHEAYLQQGADYVILGEAEHALEELLEALEHKGEVNQISGLAFFEKNKLIKTAKRRIFKDLDSLPMPAWDLVQMADYERVWRKKHGYFSLNVATTRGCPFKCNWCAKPIYGNRYTTRSPQHVAQEIEYLLQEFGNQHIWFCDDIFGLKPKWIQEFSKIVAQKQLKFTYKIQSRVDLLLQSDTLTALAHSGLDTVWVGAESGSQRILDAMDKGTKVEQIYKATQLLKQANIKVGFFLQFGYLGETKTDIDKTIQMVLDLMPDQIGISVSYPLPETKFYEKVKSELQQKANWTDSDDLALLFENTYPAAYYKRLHRYLHKVHQRKKGFQNLKKTIKNPFASDYKQLRSVLATAYYVPMAAWDAWKLDMFE